MKIAEHCVVSIHYRLTDDEGEEIDASEEGEPLVYLHGAENIIPGLEQALEGRGAGDQLEVVIQPEDAYGLVDPELVQAVPRSTFKEVDKLEPGMQLQMKTPEGQIQTITVQEVGAQEVTIDANHPLAGQVLHFAVTVEAVRAATAEEIDHGHIHDGHGHHH
jgi:FKBP-type peptidyl-prolyl cis-trans isomerase SlyD